tara:strand:+ start:571 stop:753 length:183 start_codon:yes stop_codon:yes gene_type:complete
MNYIVYRKLPSNAWKYVFRHSTEEEAKKDVRMFHRRGIEAKITIKYIGFNQTTSNTSNKQ